MAGVYSDFRGQGDYATLGLNVVLSILVGFGGGYFLDGRFGTEPIFMLVGFAFGVGAAGRFIYRTSKKMQKATLNDGFEESSTDRPARYRMKHEQRQRRGKRG